jgi:hypothetical protein
MILRLPAAYHTASPTRPVTSRNAHQFVRRLPLQGDALAAMTGPQRAAWGSDLKMTAGATREALSAASTTITVDIKLVGFNGDG